MDFVNYLNIFIFFIRFASVTILLSFLLNYSRKINSRIKLNDNRTRVEVPSLVGAPILGASLLVRKTSWDVKDVRPQTYTLQALHGINYLFQHLDTGMVKFKVGLDMVYMFSTPDRVEKLLRNYQLLNKSSFYDFLLPWLGSGLISSKEIKWKKHRRLLTPSFHFKVLDEFQPMISEKSNTLVEILKERLAEQEYIDIEPVLANYTMDVICYTAMGTDIDAQRRMNSPYVISLKRLAHLTFKRIATINLWNSSIFKWSTTGKEYYKSLEVVDSFVNTVIENRINALRGSEVLESCKDKDNVAREAKKGKLTFLDSLVLQHLLDANSLSKEDIRDEVHTFMFAGQDTTEVALTWTVFLLGNYPHCQEKLYEEIRQKYGQDKSGPLTIEDFKTMPFLEAVIKESLRLYPSVPFIGRTAKQDLEIDGILIPRGSTCGIVVPYLHRNNKEYPDPERFIPERFLPENSNSRHPYAFVPFSAGPRNCIGQRFALLEEKSAIVNIVRNFHIRSLDTVDKIPTCPELVARPAKSIRIVLTPRSH